MDFFCQRTLQSDDRAVSEWIVQGRLPDGTELDLLGCDLWQFRDGKVVRKDTYWKTVAPGTNLTQPGAMPSAVI